MKIRNILVASISTLVIGSAIIGGGILAYTNANVDKLDLLTRAVKDDKLKELQRARGDINIQAGGEHAGALIGDKLYMWGRNNYGQLGLGDFDDRNVPTLVKPPNGGIYTSFALGLNHSAAIVNSFVWTWGSNTYGELGLGDFGPMINEPNCTMWSNATQLSLGRYYTGFIAGQSWQLEIYMCGLNNVGQLGLGYQNNVNIPTLIKLQNYQAVKLSLGYASTGAIVVVNGITKIYTWGDNTFDGLGIASTLTTVITPQDAVKFNNIGRNITDIAMGGCSTGAIINGSLYMVGYNGSGQLGLGSSSNIATPQRVITSAQSIKMNTFGEIAWGSGKTNCIAIANGATIYTWGENDFGQAGTGVTGKTANTSNIFSSSSISQVAMGGTFGMMISGGKLYTWGGNSYGQLGKGNTNSGYFRPSLTDINLTSTINLDSTNDPNNSKDDIVYNVIKNSNKIRDIIEASSNQINLPNPGYQLSNITQTGRNSNNTGSISLKVESSSFPIINNITIEGFKPVNNTQTTTKVPSMNIPTNDTTFTKDNTLSLVYDANADTTGKNSKLAKWIINYFNTYVNNTNLYTVDFPENTKITKVDSFEMVNDKIGGEIKFNITVDKYYKQLGTNLISSTSSDPAIKLINKVHFVGLPNPISLEDCKDSATNEIKILNTEINPQTSPDKFFTAITGNINGGPVTNVALLTQYLDLRFIPADANITINRDPNSLTNKHEVAFTITANKYYNKGLLVSTPFSETAKFTIKTKLSSIIDNDQLHNITTGDALMAMMKNNMIDIDLAKPYLQFNDFPANTIFTTNNQIINENEKGILNLSINANKYYDNLSFTPYDRNKIFDNIEITGFKPAYDISKYPININSDQAKILMTNTEFYNKVIQNDKVDRQFLSQYIDLRAIPEDAKITIERMECGKDNSVILTIRADKYYNNGGRTITDKLYETTVSITLPTIDMNLIIILVSTGIFTLFLITCIIITIKNKNRITTSE